MFRSVSDDTASMCSVAGSVRAHNSQQGESRFARPACCSWDRVLFVVSPVKRRSIVCNGVVYLDTRLRLMRRFGWRGRFRNPPALKDKLGMYIMSISFACASPACCPAALMLIAQHQFSPHGLRFAHRLTNRFASPSLVVRAFIQQRRQYQTDMVRQKNQSVEDVHKRDTVRTAMLVNRSGVHRVTRKGGPPESR